MWIFIFDRAMMLQNRSFNSTVLVFEQVHGCFGMLVEFLECGLLGIDMSTFGCRLADFLKTFFNQPIACGV